MTVHAHSIESYHSEQPRLSTRAAQILAWIQRNGSALTDREVAAGMGYGHRSEVQPRISELVRAGFLLEVGEKVCPVTRKTVRLVSAGLA